MPVYEYKCSNGHVQIFTESIQVEHKVPEKCEKCGEDLVRLFGTPSVQFKGTGWGKD
jgi:putative FmdB family regulatory protein